MQGEFRNAGAQILNLDCPVNVRLGRFKCQLRIRCARIKSIPCGSDIGLQGEFRNAGAQILNLDCPVNVRLGSIKRQLGIRCGGIKGIPLGCRTGLQNKFRHPNSHVLDLDGQVNVCFVCIQGKLRIGCIPLKQIGLMRKTGLGLQFGLFHAETLVVFCNLRLLVCREYGKSIVKSGTHYLPCRKQTGSHVHLILRIASIGQGRKRGYGIIYFVTYSHLCRCGDAICCKVSWPRFGLSVRGRDGSRV